MGWGTGNLGGGASLNFNVKGYATEELLMAATPKENTIGIITTTPITSWIFSATEPAEPVEGMAWIATGTSSTVEFGALKKNGIRVYPISAKQYVNGKWGAVNAYIYQGGVWSQFAYMRYYFIQNGKAVIEPVSQFNATINEADGIYQVAVNDSSKHTAVNFQCSGFDGKTVHIVIDSASGPIVDANKYHSGLLVNTSAVTTAVWWPSYIAQITISDVTSEEEFTLPIPADFTNGYLIISLTASLNKTAHYNIKDMWIE
jgi:hypothetical protein